MGTSMTVDGPLARAARIEPQHLGGAIDGWLIDATHPVLINAGGQGGQIMRSQFMLTAARMDDLPGGGYPRQRDATHVLAFGMLAREFKAAWLDDGVKPAIGGMLLSAQFETASDLFAAAVCRTVAVGLARGEVPMQGRHVALTFLRCVRMVALNMSMFGVVHDTHPPIEMIPSD